MNSNACRLVFFAAIALSLVLAPGGWAQTAAGGTISEAAQVWAFFAHGGWMIVPIALCLASTLFLIMNGTARTSRERIGPLGHEQTMRALFRQNDFEGADTFCRANPSSLTNILRVGIGLIGEGQQAANDGVNAALAAERLRLHTRFSYLRALAICTPLLGVLGSLAGIISALAENHPEADGLRHAIGEALVPSAVGLFVGIVASAAFYVLRERASAAMLRLQDIVNSMFRKVPYDVLAGSSPSHHE